MRSQPHPGRQRWAEKWIHPCANLPMGKFEERTPAGATRSSLIWWRFIDDIFLLRAQGEVKLNEFINQIYPQGPHLHILMTGGRGGGGPTEVHILSPKNPNSRVCLPKRIPTFFSIPQKIPQCFCISKFCYSSSGKAKTCQLQLWFWSKTKLYKNKYKKLT